LKVDLTGKAGKLFLAAVELDGAAHIAFLDEACGGDVALRDQVTHLLAHHHDEDLVEGVARNEGLPSAALVARETGEWSETGAFVSRVLGTPRSRTVALLAVVGIVAALGRWARHAILAELDRQLHANLSRRLELEIARVEEWVKGQLVDVQSACNDPDLVQLAELLSQRGTDLNATLAERHALLTADDLQTRVSNTLERVLRREDLEGYALVHRSGVLLAGANQRFLGEQLELKGPLPDKGRFILPANP